jgi:hypothetical protein
MRTIRTPELLLQGRNFDPVSRTLKKHGNAEDLEDTVEKNVKGLAERIISEHEEKEKQDLVRWFLPMICLGSPPIPGYLQHCSQTSQLGSQAGHGKEIGKART